MTPHSMKIESTDQNNYPRFLWFFTLLFFTLGILNTIYVHIVPGLIYMLFSILFMPYILHCVYKKTKLRIPPFLLLIIGLGIIWATLGVGDIMELLEAWINDR